MSDVVTVEAVGHVLLMGVNRPEKRNAFNLAIFRELAHAYGRLAEDPQLRVGVLYGHGSHFSAGLDLAEAGPVIAEHGPDILRDGGAYDPLGFSAPLPPKPIVLAVQGIAYTLSIELALAADIVIAADDVRFRQLEVGRGFLPFGGATFRAPAQLGWGNAMRFLLTGEEFGADEAHRIGLVQEVVEPGEQLARARAIAEIIAAQAPMAIRETLTTARRWRAPLEDGAIQLVREVLPGLLHSDDAAEGLRSFVERRDAVFTGH